MIKKSTIVLDAAVYYQYQKTLALLTVGFFEGSLVGLRVGLTDGEA